MRKLGKGQSLAFYVTDEIRSRIRECTGKSRAARINVADVIRWAISETFGDIRRCMPLWAEEGQRYIRHE